MATEVRFPKFGMSTVEVYVSQIFVTVGDRVAIGDPLVEVETDKVTLTMNSEVSGVIAQVNVVKDGEYEVGDIVCLIDDN